MSGAQASMALAFPVKYQAEGSLGLIPELIEDAVLSIIEGPLHKTRLGPVRANMENTGIDGATLINYVQAEYLSWVKNTEYLIMGKWHPFRGYLRFVAVKASKRGNDVYARRLRERFLELMGLPDTRFFDWKDRETDHKTRATFTTLTYDPKKLTLGEAWSRVAEDYNRYITALRRKYGRIMAVRVWEAQKNGYPHVHAIMFFQDSEFTTFYYSGLGPHAQHSGAWRVHEKDELASPWAHGFVDVEALSSTRGGLAYVSKYLGKLHGLGSSVDVDAAPPGETSLSGLVNQASLLTLSLMWAFRKRAFSMSRGLCDLIRALHNSNASMEVFELVQVGLDGVAPAEAVTRWVLLGFWAGDLIKEGRRRWSVGLSLSELRALKGCLSWSENPYLVASPSRPGVQQGASR